MKNFKRLIILCFSIVFSCTPEDGINGKDGSNGVNGEDGSDGFSIGLVSTDLGNGCRELNFFRDSNNNGVQDGSESSITSFEVCSGITPNIAMVSQDNTSCPNGGKIFTFFNDLDDDGVLDSNEGVLGSESICNGTDGADGIDGNAGSGYALFIEQATTSECSNGGFKVSVFTDLNSNAEYDSGSETISKSTVICYPDKYSIDIPDYSALGHTFEALGVWRLYSVRGVPVPESHRFNIHVYPDNLNPELLIENKQNQTGWVEFPGGEPVPWKTSGRSTGSSAVNFTTLILDYDLVPGVTNGRSGGNLPWDGIQYHNTVNPKYLYMDLLESTVDTAVYKSTLRQAKFLKVQ
jgi:hypothetical protein